MSSPENHAVHSLTVDRCRRPRRSRAILSAALALALAVVPLLFVSSVEAQAPVKLQVEIQSVVSLDCMDVAPCDGASFYANVFFDGALHSNIRQTSRWYGRDQIAPNWRFVWDTHEHDTVDIDLEIWDEDGFLRFGPDQLDLDPASAPTVDARRLSFRVDVQECLNGGSGALIGEASGTCGRVVSEGREAGIRGIVHLDVSVEPPPAAGDLRVRCLHDPLWPQPGDTVTVIAEALDEAPVGKGPFATSIPTLKIFAHGNGAPSRTCNGTSCTMTLPAVQGTSFSYACLAEVTGGLQAWTGWRAVQVGNVSGGRAIPVLLTGPQESRVDVVLIPSQTQCDAQGCFNYTSAFDPRFLQHAHDIVRTSFYEWDIHLRHQDAINVWLATDFGAYDDSAWPFLTPPPDWDSVYAFADAGIIVHEDPQRDAALPSGRIFSSEPLEPRTVMHETGHAPFGLSDEYCCDPPYVSASPLPNVYPDQNACVLDIPDLQKWDASLTAASCREIHHNFADGSVFRTGWWVADPPNDDLMESSGDRTPQAADIRRIEWLYGACKESGCADMRR